MQCCCLVAAGRRLCQALKMELLSWAQTHPSAAPVPHVCSQAGAWGWRGSSPLPAASHALLAPCYVGPAALGPVRLSSCPPSWEAAWTIPLLLPPWLGPALRAPDRHIGEAYPCCGTGRPLPQALPEMQTSEKGILLRPGYYGGTLDPASSSLPRDPFLLSSAPPIPRNPSVPSAQSHTEGTPCPLSPAVPQRPQSTVP